MIKDEFAPVPSGPKAVGFMAPIDPQTTTPKPEKVGGHAPETTADGNIIVFKRGEEVVIVR